MKLAKLISVSGYTQDNKPVIAGLFRLHDTHGWSLGICAMALAKAGAMVDWESFIADARKVGWGEDKIRGIISDAAYLGYGISFRRDLLTRLYGRDNNWHWGPDG